MGVSYRGRDGQEFEIDPATITKIAWADDEGEHEVEGHGWRVSGRDDQSEVEGHGFRGWSRDGQEYEVDLEKVTKIAWGDDDGDHEVEGHGYRFSG